MIFGTIPQAIADIRAGKLVVVADDEDRENEGDLICAAQLVTPARINFMLKAKGMICLALTGERVDQLGLPAQGDENTDAFRTAFTVRSRWIPRPCGTISDAPGTCTHFARATAACSSASGTPKRPWISRVSRACIRLA
jgi:3,4-dihydroxy-2-butanone 4-phosphate synthase